MSKEGYINVTFYDSEIEFMSLADEDVLIYE